MYELPTGYQCITRSNDGNYLYAYNSNIRDTYGINGFSWQKISTNYNSSLPNSSVCLESPQYPNQFAQSLILPATLIVLAFFKIILNMFMGVRR